MGQPDANFLARPNKAFEMGGDEIDQQHAADQVAAGKNRDFPGCRFRPPINEEAAEELVLRLEQAQLDLGERAPENQYQAKAETDDRQAQRGEEGNQAIK